MNEISPQYIAGLADSDGSFGIAKRVRGHHKPTYSARFMVHWKKHPYALMILKQIQSMFGGNVGTVKHKSGEFYTYSLSDKSMDLFLKEVGPYVMLKSRQVETLLELRKSVHYRNGKVKADSLLAHQEFLYEKIKELNHAIT
jgi:hypothetical protein